jgi:preprotein translocase subunit SecG
MFTVFLILAMIAALILFPAILLQAGQGGGLATQFGGASSTEAFVGGRQAATLLHKASWGAGLTFLGLCFLMSLVTSHGARPRSLTEEQLRQQQQQTAPTPLAPIPLNNAAPAPTGQQNAPAQPRPATTPAR